MGRMRWLCETAVDRDRDRVLLAGIGTAFLGYASVWAIGSAATVAAVVAALVMDVATAVGHAVTAGDHPIAALGKVFVRRPGHWGADGAHTGLVLLVIGVMGSSVYTAKQDITLKIGGGETAHFGAYTLKLTSLDEVRRPNHTAKVATLELSKNGETFTLQPERRFYDRGTDPGQSASVVAIRMGFAKDLYVTLAGWDEKLATVEIISNPLVNWIWIGGILMTLGALMALIGLASAACSRGAGYEEGTTCPAECKDSPRAAARQTAANGICDGEARAMKRAAWIIAYVLAGAGWAGAALAQMPHVQGSADALTVVTPPATAR